MPSSSWPKIQPAAARSRCRLPPLRGDRRARPDLRCRPSPSTRRDTFDLYLQSARRLAREVLFPAYKAMDESPPGFANGSVIVHPRMHEI